VAGWAGGVMQVADAAEAVGRVQAAGPADTVLVKASNAFQLWQVAELLLADDGAVAGGSAVEAG
jgi:UDP-N-acetylmuramyl pentapeptide synthase